MGISEITSRGRVIVPKQVLESLALRPGDLMSFVVHDDGTVTLKAEPVELSSLRGALKSNGRHVSVEQMCPGG